MTKLDYIQMSTEELISKYEELHEKIMRNVERLNLSANTSLYRRLRPIREVVEARGYKMNAYTGKCEKTSVYRYM